MKKYINKLFVVCSVLFLSLNGFAQNTNAQQGNQTNAKQEAVIGFEDPLIPQFFAVDNKTQTIAVTDTSENTIDILKRQGKNFVKVKSILVDVVVKRHDVAFIYKPKSVAIYDNNVVFLASNRDSSFIRVLSMQGNTLYESPRFVGAASAFSYDKLNKKLYIAGVNKGGYNIFDIDVSKGFKNMVIDSVTSDRSVILNYQIPKKADEIQKHDPHGLGLTVIAMGTVFLALLLIVLLLMGFARSLKSIQIKRANKAASHAEETPAPDKKKVQDISGDEFAVIAAAIYMYNDELHDEENTVLTIDKVEKRYSPWSSKQYNMNVYRRR
jgi:Na+-transporting methylmalonyl-CoA/oxaloacetate decarboxylase gamma subunit